MTEIRIIVCTKQIPDPEAPLSDVSVDAEKMEVIVDAPQVISPFDENALEAAVRLKEEGGGKISVLSLGKKVSDTVLRKTLAAGADELILLEDNNFRVIVLAEMVGEGCPDDPTADYSNLFQNNFTFEYSMDNIFHC